MECRKITIARLRSGVNYKRPLDHIIDSFCYLLKRFQIKNSEFRYGVSDRGASIRIPMGTANDGYGYLEDRRPSANADPYEVCFMLMHTVCVKQTEKV